MGEQHAANLELRTAVAKLTAAEHAIADARRILEELGADAVAPAPPPGSTAAPPTPPSQSEQQPPPQPQPQPISPRPEPVANPYAAAKVTQFPAPAQWRHRSSPKPPAPDKPLLTLEQKVVRGIAIGGALITIIGVGLLIALAIQNGWLGPLGRVIGVAIFGTVLLVTGLRLYSHRSGPGFATQRGSVDPDSGEAVPTSSGPPRETTGATALITTSYLVFSLLVIALVHWLEWWPQLIGAVVLVLIHLSYLALARRLELVWLSYAVATVGGVISLSYLSIEPATWLIATLALLTLIATLGSTWLPTRVIAGVVAIGQQVLLMGLPGDDVQAFTTLLGAVSVLGFLLAGLKDPIDATDPGIDSRRMLLVVPIVLLATLLSSGHATHWIWSAPALALAFSVLGRVCHGRDEVIVGLCALPVVFLPIWLAPPPFGALAAWGPSVVLAIFLVLSVIAVQWMAQENTHGRAPWVCWLATLLVMTSIWGLDVIARAPLWLTGTAALILSLLLAALIAQILLRYRAFTIFHVWQQVVGAVILLYLSMLVIVTLATYLGDLLADQGGRWLGYFLGHATVSILWMVLGAWVLLAHTSFNDRTSLGIGVILAAAATGKLVFFDLAALAGIPRVLAFLVCGVVLLAIAALRSRRTSGETTAAEGDVVKHTGSTAADVGGAGAAQAEAGTDS